MNTWAVIRTGGKQYKVEVGQTLDVEKLGIEDGKSVTFDQVLLIKDEKSLKIGKPNIDKAKVIAKLVENFKDKKIRVVKFKSKSRYLRTNGHRHQKSKVTIEKIES